MVSEPERSVKVLNYRNGSYHIIDTLLLDHRNLTVLASDLLGLSINILSPVEFVQQAFCNIHHNLELKTLSNATIQLTYRQ